MAEGRTFEELHALAGGFAATLHTALNDELRRGRLRRDGPRYVLVPDAFPDGLLAALRGLDPNGLRSPPAANGRPPLARETAGQLAASYPEFLGRRAAGAIAGTRGVELG